MGMNEGIVPIMYGVEGKRDLTELRLDHLAGYAGSRPVLVGNDAWQQRQSDMSGEPLAAAWLMRERNRQPGGGREPPDGSRRSPFEESHWHHLWVTAASGPVTVRVA
jgi:hypothetical protein